ncbi:hypothetical protein ACMBCM_08595 [Spiroplasma sp. K1]
MQRKIILNNLIYYTFLNLVTQIYIYIYIYIYIVNFRITSMGA